MSLATKIARSTVKPVMNIKLVMCRAKMMRFPLNTTLLSLKYNNKLFANKKERSINLGVTTPQPGLLKSKGVLLTTRHFKT